MNPDRKKGQGKHPREVHPPARSHADDPEPSSATHPLPVWLFILLAVGLFAAMVYLDSHAGGFSSVVYRPYRSSNELAGMVPFDPAQADYFAGMKVYNRPTCASCHQSSGQGTPGQGFPPLAGAEWVLEKDPSRIIRIVLDGLTGPIQVKGQTFGNAQMLGWRNTLNDEEIAQVLTYVRKEKSWGNNAPAVTAKEVAEIRKETAAHDGKYWTVEELMQVPLKQ
jgi:mono/diheme cytochrome c family protein